MPALREKDFDFGVPVALAFAAPLEPREAQSKYGPPQMSFSSDAGAIFLDAEYARQIFDAIEAQGIQPGEGVRVTKTRAGKGMRWTVERARPVSAGPVYVPPVPNGQTNGHNGHTNGQGDSAPLPPAAPVSGAQTAIAARMMACFAAAIDALVESQAYADRRGLKVTFTSEDVRAVAISCYIDACRGSR